MDKNVGASVLARASGGMCLFVGFAPLRDSYQGMPSGIPQAARNKSGFSRCDSIFPNLISR
jgi:hypothetical protein